MARFPAVLAKDGPLVKYVRYYWLPRADGQAISVILLTAGEQGIVSGIKPTQQVVSNGVLMQNMVEQK